MSLNQIILISVIAIIIILILIMFVMGIKVVPQTNCYVVERLGKYHKTWETGIHFKLPLIDRIAKKISMKEQVINFRPQTVITKDNVTMEIDTVLFYMVTDSKQFSYGVQNTISAIENLTATTLRNAIGTLELDKTLTSRDYINGRLQASLDTATNSWGIKVIRVEVKNILPPIDVRTAMEKQMRAEREKRAVILKSEGDKQSRILQAEGKKEATIKEAEGVARALLVKQKALSDSIKILNEAKPSKEALALRGFDTFIKVSESDSTKIIIPSDLQDLSKYVATASEIFKTTNNSDKSTSNKATSIKVKPRK